MLLDFIFLVFAYFLKTLYDLNQKYNTFVDILTPIDSIFYIMLSDMF